jgi:hypothetical protein
VTRGFQPWQRACGVWGPPNAYAGRPDRENPFYRQDYTHYVRTHPEKELPYLLITPATGAHNEEMGWPPFPRFFRALMDTKRAFVASWGRGSWNWRPTPVLQVVQSGQLVLRRDQSLPAFAHCSLDDNPGCGDIRDGDYMGQINGYLLWETDSLVDEPGRWEMTVWLDESAPRPVCTVDLTPRRCQKFKPPPGPKWQWSNVSPVAPESLPDLAKVAKSFEVKEDQVIQSGSVTADRYGLVTLKGLVIGKVKHRIRIERAGIYKR